MVRVLEIERVNGDDNYLCGFFLDDRRHLLDGIGLPLPLALKGKIEPARFASEFRRLPRAFRHRLPHFIRRCTAFDALLPGIGG